MKSFTLKTGVVLHATSGAPFIGSGFFSFLLQVMGEDIVPEKIKDEVHSEVKCVGSASLTSLVIASSKEFEDRWFGKIKDHFCSFENRFHTQIQISTE